MHGEPDSENLGDDVPCPEPVAAPFLSEEHGSAFVDCSLCGAKSIDSLLIVKTWSKGQWIFEAALCLKCEQGFKSEVSKESLKRIAAWRQRSSAKPPTREIGWPHCDHCHLRIVLDDTSEAEVSGWTVDQNLWSSNALCGSCLSELHSLISQKTREHYDRFVARLQPWAPSESGLSLPPQTLVLF